MIKIWLDDIRPAPDGFLWCHTAQSALDILKMQEVEYIDFDHDLGMYSLDGYMVAVYIETLAHAKKIKRLGWSVHSDNPAGRERIKNAMLSAERFWDISENKEQI